MVLEFYEIRVRGLLGPLLGASFEQMGCTVTRRPTVCHGTLSGDQLRVLLERLDQLGLDLIDLAPRPDART